MDQPGLTRIPARSRRQTMDWSLVLASQGIAATLDDASDGAGWGLLVSPADHPAALEAIRLYRLENRHWRWRQPLTWPGLLFDWRVIFWAVLLATFHWFKAVARPDLALAGRMDSAAAWAGEWWRPFTAVWLHADVAHLAANICLGVVLLGLAMGRYGGGMGLLAAYLAGVAGNLANLLLHPGSHRGLGASGMVMGGLGLLAAQSVVYLRHHPLARKQVFKGVFAGVMLFVLFGLGPGTDIVAHLGGFLAGLVLGAMLARLPARWQSSGTDLAAWLALTGLAGATWWLALWPAMR
jgi:rhomboid protease GluP